MIETVKYRLIQGSDMHARHVKTKIHQQTGTYRVRVTPGWAKANKIASKDELDAIEGKAFIILPKKLMSNEDIEEMINEIREQMPIIREKALIDIKRAVE
jgi:hypothetical protein